jgi:hypothetical protein
MIAGISGVVLFIALFFFDWYSVGIADEVNAAQEQLEETLGVDAAPAVVEDAGVTGWDAFDFTNLVCLLAIIVAVGLAAMTLFGASASLPVAGSALTCGIGGLALLLVLYRTLDPPGDGLDRDFGLFVGLLAAAGITVGGYLGMQEEGTTFSEQGDRLRS